MAEQELDVKEIFCMLEDVMRGEALPERDACLLMRSEHVHALGMASDMLRQKQCGDEVGFVINRQINYTNICTARCAFCAFHATPGSDRGYLLSLEEVLEKAAEAVRRGATELHIVGGHNPEVPFEYYEEMLRMLRERFPEVHLKAFTATEIAFFSKNFRMSVREVLERLREAGLQSLPGGGAEILDDSLRSELCPGKAGAREWLEVMRTAHSMGILSTATMLFGHVETPEQRVRHMAKLRELQAETGGFLAFIPLLYQPENNPLARRYGLEGATPQDVLRTISVARLMLGASFRNIRAYWVMLGRKLAQVALHYGANDLDGTVIEEKVASSAGAGAASGIDVEELVHLIKDAGRVPVQRTTDYRVVRRF